jgi:hypothetical protein
MDISNQKPFLTVKDYSVSEIFDLYHDAKLDMLITTPQPSLENLKVLRKRRFSRTRIAKGLYLKKAYHFVKELRLKKN